MANKLLQQQIRNILRSLQAEELGRLLSNYMNVSKTYIEKSVRMISYKCYEATVSVSEKKINGYGRTEGEATTNAINNIFELLLEDDRNIPLIKTALTCSKGGVDPPHYDKNPVGMSQEINSKPSVLVESSKMMPNTHMGHTYSKPHHIPPTFLAPSAGPAHNNSFLRDSEVSMSLDLEGLSKNIGQNNISIIGNSSNFLNSQLEIDDVLLKIMQDEGQSKSKHQGGGYGGTLHSKTVGNSNSRLRNSSQDSNKLGGPPPRQLSPPKAAFSKQTRPHSRYEALTNASYEKTELAMNTFSSAEPTVVTKPVHNDMRKNPATLDSSERLAKSPRSTNESGFGVNGSRGGFSSSHRKMLSQAGGTSTGPTNPCCMHSLDLRAAIDKIEALEARVAHLTDENEHFKRTINEQDQKLRDVETRSVPPKENLYSKEFTSTLSKHSLLGKSAQLTQKILTEIHNLQISQDEIGESSPINIKGRSSSVDIQLQKKKSGMGNCFVFSLINADSGTSDLGASDVKKPTVPKLRMDVLEKYKQTVNANKTKINLPPNAPASNPGVAPQFSLTATNNLSSALNNLTIHNAAATQGGGSTLFSTKFLLK